MKTLNLSQGKVTIIDDDNYEYLNRWKWSLNPNGYASRRDSKLRKKIYLHRVVNNTPKDKMTDHINGDRLDNRKENLRTCNNPQNGANRFRDNRNKSGYKGVVFYKRHNKWRAYIHYKNKSIHLGYFNTAEEAAKVYNEAADRFHNSFARLNTIGEIL